MCLIVSRRSPILGCVTNMICSQKKRACKLVRLRNNYRINYATHTKTINISINTNSYKSEKYQANQQKRMQCLAILSLSFWNLSMTCLSLHILICILKPWLQKSESKPESVFERVRIGIGLNQTRIDSVEST